MLDGLGVQATIVDSDIRATNGIIHQIDKVNIWKISITFLLSD